MLQFKPQGIYCVPGAFYIDPWQPVNFAVITHGHADHARPGMKHYCCHYQSVPILKRRLGPGISIQGLAYNEPVNINGVRLSLHPAGHIIGSAQVRMEYQGKIIVASGDYKLQDDGLTPPIEIVKCHEFITESTFGLPIYNWLTVDQQEAQLLKWIEQNQLQGKNSVLIGYALGKAQRIMKAVQPIGIPLVHYSIATLNGAYEEAGVKLPPYTTIDLREDLKAVNRSVIILPPSLADTNLIKKIPEKAEAICSGWMQVRGARRWRNADQGFAISDHADWQGLLTVIKNTGAQKVYVTHGQTAVMARYLNELGIEAAALQTEFGNEEEETTEATKPTLAT